MKKFVPYLVLIAVLAVGAPVIYLLSDFSVDLADPSSVGLVPMLHVAATIAVLMGVCCSLYVLADWLVSRLRKEPRVQLNGEMVAMTFILSGLALSWVFWTRYATNPAILPWIHLMGSLSFLVVVIICLARQQELKHYQPIAA